MKRLESCDSQDQSLDQSRDNSSDASRDNSSDVSCHPASCLTYLDSCVRMYHPAQLPIAFVCASSAGLALSYILAALVQGDVSPVFPRISHTGNSPPASMVFSFTLGVSALLLVATSAATFTAFKRLIEANFGGEERSREEGEEVHVANESRASHVTNESRALSLNRLCLVCGVVSGVGVLGVGCFQVSTSRLLHYIPLVVMTVAGYGYFALHTFHAKTLLRATCNNNFAKEVTCSAERWYRMRLCVMAGGGACLVGMFVLGGVARLNWEPSVQCTPHQAQVWEPFNNCSIKNRNWKEGDGGFVWFAASNACQWAWLASFFVMVATLRRELLTIPSLLGGKHGFVML